MTERQLQELRADLAAKRATYDAVRELLDPEERERVERLRERYEANPASYEAAGHYGHDLAGAISRADRRRRVHAAGEYLAGPARDNLFTALGMLAEAYLARVEPTRSGETRPNQLIRALESQLRRARGRNL